MAEDNLPPDIQVEEPEPSDDRAQDELAFYTSRSPAPPELPESRRRYLKDLMDLRSALFWGARVFTRIVIILLIGAVATWWWHLIGPKGARWLEPEEVENLQALISSGAVAALVTAMGKRLFPAP